MIQVGADENGRTITLTVGDELTVDLPEVATGGFRWSTVPIAIPGISVAGEQRIPARGTVGGAGRHTWLLRAHAPGVGVFRATYSRTFGGGPVDSEYVLHIAVKAPG